MSEQTPPPNYPQQTPNYQQQGPIKPKGMAIAALVLGICAFVPGCCIPWLNWIVAPVCAVLAIIFGRMAMKAVARGEAEGHGMAKTGVILGIINLILVLLGIILLIAGISALSVYGDDIAKEIERQNQIQNGNNGNDVVTPDTPTTPDMPATPDTAAPPNLDSGSDTE